MRQAVVLGTGGHCRVILSILKTEQRHEVMAIIELGSPREGETIMGLTVMPNPNILEMLFGRRDVDVFLAIGDNDIRKHWWARVKNIGLPMPNLVSTGAQIDNSAYLGESNVICARAFVGPEAELGNNNLINTGAIVEHEVKIGHHCNVASAATIAGRSRIADSVFVGAGAVIVDGVSIASETILGAGATLIKSIYQPNGVYLGTPAKRWADRK